MGSHLPWKSLWKLPLPAKLRFLTWSVLLDLLQTASRLFHLNISHSNICLLCHSYPETVDHLFTQCGITIAVWNLLLDTIINPTKYTSFAAWFWSSISNIHHHIGIIVTGIDAK